MSGQKSYRDNPGEYTEQYLHIRSRARRGPVMTWNGRTFSNDTAPLPFPSQKAALYKGSQLLAKFRQLEKYRMWVGPRFSEGRDIKVNPARSRHSAKWDRCVRDVKRRGSAVNAYAVCTAALKGRRNPAKLPLDPTAKRELILWAMNESALYPQRQAIQKNLHHKMNRGTYDPVKAVRLWRYWIDAAARAYAREFAEASEWQRIFSVATRQAAAVEVARDEGDAIRRGEYDEPPARRNPSPRAKLDVAAKKLEDFTGHRVERVVRAPARSNDTTGLVIGELDLVGYRAKRDGKFERYGHEFRKDSRPLLAVSTDGKQLHIVGGRYEFTEAGIEDR